MLKKCQPSHLAIYFCHLRLSARLQTNSQKTNHHDLSTVTMLWASLARKRCLFPAEVQDLSLPSVQTWSGTQPLPIQWAVRALSPGVKQSGCDADSSPPPNAGVNNQYNCNSIPLYAFTVFTFTYSSSSIPPSCLGCTNGSHVKLISHLLSIKRKYEQKT